MTKMKKVKIIKINYSQPILINNQCISIKNETCIPKKMINITKVKNNNINNSLKYFEFTDFKGLPFPICLFNLTDNVV